MEIKDEYVISEKYVLNTDTWNKGIKLTNKYLKISVTQFLSDMVKIDAVGFDNSTKKDTSNVYLGYWVPFDSLKILEEI